MKKQLSFLFVLFTFNIVFANNDLTADFIFGDPAIKSINAMDFGPQGILFLGDSQHASIFAIDTDDTKEQATPSAFKMENVDLSIAALLGTTKEAMTIQDMAINPISKSIYFAIHLQDGTPVLLKTNGVEFEVVDLNAIKYSKMDLVNPISSDAKDRRGRSQRKWAISDLNFHENEVMVSGLSNEEFSSTFRRIPFPFKDNQSYASLEIYHAAHGRYETYAPIKTFMPYNLNGKSHLLASYTCTPLVVMPLDEFKAGQHTKGKTVAELGNRNTPLDFVSYKKGDKDFILLANTSRALMKLDPEKIANYKDYLTTPVEENSMTAGVEFINLPYVNVLQMDKFDDQNIVLLQRLSNGSLNLHAPSVRRL